MRILRADWKKGIVEVVPEYDEDLYYLSLVIEKGDTVFGWTTRVVKPEDELARPDEGKRRRFYLGVDVQRTEFQRFTDRLRIHGVIVECPERLHAKGSHHTLSVSLGDELRISKKSFFVFQKRLLRRSERRSYKNLLLSIGDESAAVCVLRAQGLQVVAEISNKSSGERGERGKRGSRKQAYTGYLEDIIEFLNHLLEAEEFHRILVAAPHLLWNWFSEYARGKTKVFSRMEFFKVSEGGLAGVYELARDKSFAEKAKSLRLTYETALVNELSRALSDERGKASVGKKEVGVAASLGAVRRLLILDDELYKLSEDEEMRSILEEVERRGGEITVVAARSEAGSSLKSFGGVAALLYFPVQFQA